MESGRVRTIASRARQSCGRRIRDDISTGDAIPEVLNPDRMDARFVVAMAIARNDIEVALRGGIAADDDDVPTSRTGCGS
jgi:hypothetical protein